jgi:hypothetical protein
MDYFAIPFQCIQAGMHSPVADPEISSQKIRPSGWDYIPRTKSHAGKRTIRIYLKKNGLSNIGKFSGKGL